MAEQQTHRRPKITIADQIQHFKNKGVKFEIFPEDNAMQYLRDNTYFFKLKAYAKIFEVYQTTDRKGQYIDLDFAYLVEMARIDMQLRRFIIGASLDIEHAIKVRFMADFVDSESDGYEVVDKYFECYPDVRERIIRKKQSTYCSDLINKLESEGYAIWNLIEVLSFGEFINFYKSFYESFPNARHGKSFEYPLRSIKSLRNAAAHNNCILNQLSKKCRKGIHENKEIISYVSHVETIGKSHRRSCMEMQAVHDFVTLIYMIDTVGLSDRRKASVINDLNTLVNKTMVENRDFFRKCALLLSTYSFIQKLIDSMQCHG